MMRVLVLGLVFGCLFSYDAFAGNEDLDAFIRTNARNAWILANSLGDEESDELIQRIKMSPHGGDFGRIRGEVIAANLGDEELIEYIYQWHKKGYIVTRLGSLDISHPTLLKVAGDDVFNEPKRLRRYKSDWVLDPPHSVAIAILEVVSTWGEFSSETREWARRILEDSYWSVPETYLEDAREFWRRNRNAIMSEKFENVVPLEKRYGESRPPLDGRVRTIDPADVQPGGSLHRERQERERQERDHEGRETSEDPEDGA